MGAEDTRRGLKEGGKTEVETHDWCQEVQATPLGDVHDAIVLYSNQAREGND